MTNTDFPDHDTSPAVPRSADAPQQERPISSARRLFAATTLALESFVVLFATFAVHGMAAVPTIWDGAAPTLVSIWLAGGGLMVTLLVLSRVVSAPGGYIAGSLVQIPVLATGFIVPMMFLVGGVFVAVWWAGLRLGARIDRERAEYWAQHPTETGPRESLAE